MQSRSTPVHWYVIAKADADLPTLVRELESVGCRHDASTPSMTLGHGEQLLEVIGPDDLAARMKGNGAIVRICPEVRLEPM